MKSIIKTCCLATLGTILPLAAQVSKTTETTESRRGADGSVTDTTTTTTTFNPEARTKVVTYFNEYKGNPHGLPPGYATRIQVKEIPSNWRTSRIEPGVVITEAQRSYLVAATPDLVKVLPAPGSGIRYYIAGSNVVAVDDAYKIVDSVQIPSIKYTEDEDKIEIESKEGNTTTKTKIDKDDGEIEVDKEKDE
ncbi:MAG: hypothetical protein RLZZ214_1225 [Verrucomicrobiota bacterium]|jgi:hypothetical protein